MSKITRVEIFQVDLAPKAVRSDAIQAFTKQETPIVRTEASEAAGSQSLRSSAEAP